MIFVAWNGPTSWYDQIEHNPVRVVINSHACSPHMQWEPYSTLPSALHPAEILHLQLDGGGKLEMKRPLLTRECRPAPGLSEAPHKPPFQFSE